MLFLILKWLHVLSAIVAVGANITYGFWMARASRDPKALPFTLRGIKLIDDRMANPAYVVLLITGLAMAHAGGFSIKAPWLFTALILYVLVAAIGLFGYTPNLRRQIQSLDSEGFQSPQYQALARRGTMLGAVLGILTMVIVFLMVVKPGLWA
jgi:uncharacterized membrane protein